MDNINLIETSHFYQKKGFWYSIIGLAVVIIVVAGVWYMYGQNPEKNGGLTQKQIDAISKAFANATTTKLTPEQTKAISQSFKKSTTTQLSNDQVEAISKAFQK